MAGPFLKAAVKSTEATIQAIQDSHTEIQVTMFAAGAKRLTDLVDQIVEEL